MTLKRVSIPSPNYSSRGGAGVRLIVLHTAEGATTYQSLGSFFSNSSSGVSSHVGIDDTPNTVGEYVGRSQKAWTAANANPVAVQAELCAFAAWTASDWSKHQGMLQNCAQWIKEEAAAFGIPIVKLNAQQAQSNGRGVCQHRDLGSWGGGHTDCGNGFPIDQVLSMAQGGTPPQPQPEEEDEMSGPVAFEFSNVQQVFYISTSGNLMHLYVNRSTNKWASESLGGGWDKKAQLCWEINKNGTPSVWGMHTNGKSLQCYWSGDKWLTQQPG
jgi:hypothetical protein